MITIIVPIFNIERFLPTTVQSLLTQEGDMDYEIILVDDGSTDGSPVLCDKYASENRKIRVIHKDNGGLSSARNAGLEIATGDYILFLDGDDCLVPNTLSSLSKAANEHFECDLIQFRYEEVSAATPYGHKVNSALIDYYECDNEHDFFMQLYQLGGVAASACTKLIKRAVLSDLRFKEGIIHEDEQFTTHLLQRCKCVGYCSNEFYKYTMRQGSIIHSGFSPKELQTIDILNERIDYLRHMGYSDLVTVFQSRLFANLCLMWPKVYAIKDYKSLSVIEVSMNYACVRSKISVLGLENKLILYSGCLRSLTCKSIYYTKKIVLPLKRKVKNALTKLKNRLECKRRRDKLKYKDFSIISNNCWGGLVYQYFGLPYSSPTVGLFIMDDDYIKFLERFDYYIEQPLRFISFDASRYYDYLSRESTAKMSYPIARLDDIEVHFMHYHSKEEAETKWTRRCKRINRNRLLVKMSQRYISGIEILDRFDAVPFKNKICFTEADYPKQGFIKIEELKHLNIQGGDETPYVMNKVDLVQLVNSLS